MKKLITVFLSVTMLLAVLALCAGAADNSAWLIPKGEGMVCPAELTKGYTEANSAMIDVNLSGYSYLHFKMMFAKNTHVEYPACWGYMVILDNEAAVGKYETSTNVVSLNIAETKDYTGGTWYDVVVPFSSFNAYGAGSKPIAEWTESAKMVRFVLVAADNSELSFKDFYVSVNENDTAPADPVEPSPNTGNAIVSMTVAAVISLSAAGIIIGKKKR